MANSRNAKFCLYMSTCYSLGMERQHLREGPESRMAGELGCSPRIAPNTGSISLAAAAKAALIQPQPRASPAEPVLAAPRLPPPNAPPAQPQPSRLNSRNPF